MGAYSQNLLGGNKFGDNWSVGLRGGVVTPFTHSKFFKNMRPAVGLEVNKQITPVFGLGVEGMGYINTTPSRTAFDGVNVNLLGSFNLMNLLGGYTGEPRVFEIIPQAGMGWFHSFENGYGDYNALTTKFGVNFQFNLGEAKAWSLSLRPALVYDMCGKFKQADAGFNANRAAVEITAGLAYHFGGSNGKHHFSYERAYDQAEVDALNQSVNELRAQVDSKSQALDAANRQAAQLSQELAECRNRKPEVQKVVETAKTLESVVNFRQGRSTVDASQLPNVERIASFLNKHKDAKVVIKGYASPEGSAEVNERIAAARAAAVKKVLTRKYRIAADRIMAEGQGVGNMFSEPDWNRVSICTIQDNK